ncbi:MAG: phage virion morphogenesis protein [Methylobacter tundripaludum]|nr:phage virion morphogenesis protein [Methylobacter tundripaludum]
MSAIDVDDREILAALRQLQQSTGNLRPALLKIGEDLKESTKQRFSSKTGPDGQAWLGNADSTIERKGRDFPLTEGGTLGNTIDYQLFGNDGVDIGSPMKYAAMMQFGGTKAEFPNLWGDVPGRPFLGISEDDKVQILATIQRHLSL